jgi:hypothetical protein
MRTDAAKRRVLQTLAGAFLGNALLYRWKMRSSGLCKPLQGSCYLCGALAETQAHIQCVCVALKAARISAHHNLAGTVFASITRAGQGWSVYRELTLIWQQVRSVPAATMDDWARKCDALMDCDLETAAERALASGIRRKRPDEWAVHWGRRRIRILEFIRCNNFRQDL